VLEPTPLLSDDNAGARAAAAAGWRFRHAGGGRSSLTAEEATKVGESIVRIRRNARVLGALKLSPAEEPLWNGVPADADGVK
jgi:hypothetical protein